MPTTPTKENPIYEVQKYTHHVPLTDGCRTCARAVRYNLFTGVHTDVDDGTRCIGDVDTTTEESR